MTAPEIRLEHPDGSLFVEEVAGNRRRLRADPAKESTFVTLRETETAYPLELIQLILRVKGVKAVCDEIEREERPGYLQHLLWWTMRAHVDSDEVGGGRLLDFGCGSGASTMILSRMFPDAEIVGVDIDAEALEIAEARRRHYRLDQVSFTISPEPTRLPEGLGDFDFIVFSAVYEHLLPEERRTIIPMLWTHLRETGLLFVGETPHRFTPIEIHTTGGLPLVNYLPAPLALRAARRFSKRVARDATWQELLRKGMRGGTERRFLRILRRAGHTDAVIRRPTKQGLRDEFDLWYEISSRNELPGLKGRLRTAFRGLRRVTGISFTPYLAFAVQKRAGAEDSDE
jgi:2-polyprenyl-3-methyl-5-hydroxy-6-metoxy-1,4-benzoquinol methylase